MKQIVITKSIMHMAKEYAKKLFADKSSDFVQPVDGLKHLITDLKEVNDGLPNKDEYIKYLKEIIKDYSELKKLHPDDFGTYKAKYDGILSDKLLSTKIKHRVAQLPKKRAERDKLKPTEGVFYELVVGRMHYKEARIYLAPYMEKIGIQTCVYCNNYEAIYSEELEEAYYHFDHWMPKDKYTFLCICFFNLYPCCSNCNGHKLDGSKGEFRLYANALPVKDPFVFTIDKSAYDENKPETLSVHFKPRNITVDGGFRDEYNKVYRIEQFYNSDGKKRSCLQLIRIIDKYRGHYSTATSISIPGIVDKETLFKEVLGVNDDVDNIFTDVNKKLKLDTAIDAKLI